MQRAVVWLTGALALGGGAVAAGAHGGPVATYSIVARDPATGAFGVAVQSHWFQVGTLVPWAEAGVGAVATQSFVRPEYGPGGLDLMRAGVSADDALERLRRHDPRPEVRQVAMVDRNGRAAAWTGPRSIREAGHLTGEGWSVQANLMASPGVPEAMAKAYREAPDGDFAGRLIAALAAAEAAGGDLRGRQSAALLIVRGEPSGAPWSDRLVDLRVDDHPDPLVELRRLLRLTRAYDEARAGDEALAAGEVERALGRYDRARQLAPGNLELSFWQAVSLTDAGRADVAAPIFARLFRRDPRWIELTRRLPAAGLLPDDPALMARILAEASPPAAGAEATTAVRLEGRLTDEGVECPALRGADGELYTLIGELSGFAPGDEVWIEGEPAAVSVCMQGTTLRVIGIGRR